MSVETNGEHSFTWKIENFSMSPLKNGECFQSPQFTTENVGDSKWVLILFPKGANIQTSEHISLFLNRSVKEMREAINDINVKIEAVAPDGDILESIESTHLLFKRGSTFAWKKFYKIDKMAEIVEDWKEDILTIRCTMFNRKREEYECRTKIGVDRCFFKWKLKTPDDLDQPNFKEFFLYDECHVKIRMAIVDDDVKLSIIRKEKGFFPSRHLSCRVSLLGTNGSKIDSKRDMHCFKSEDGNIWELPTFISIHQLKDNKSYFRNGSFTLLFEFSSANRIFSNAVSSPTCRNFPSVNHAIKLRENLKDMYINKIHSDVELCVDNETFRSHKSILAARSPVFSAMFDQDMLESMTGVVNISDVEANIFKHFLQYLYTATVNEMDYETTSKLFLVAERYQVLDLKLKCADMLMSVLSEENVYEVLSLADMVNNIDLKVFALDYITEHTKEIFTSSEWMKWSAMNIKLASEVISNIAIKLNKEITLQAYQEIFA